MNYQKRLEGRGKSAAQVNAANAFENMAMQHLDAVYRAAYALSRSPETAEDLTQATFLKALGHSDTFELNTNCKAWLLRILRNTWIDQLRRAKIAGPQALLDEATCGEATEDEYTTWSDARDLLENFSDEHIIDALGQLGEEQRLTLYLMDVEGLTQEEIADITGVAVGTVKSRTSRARAAMKKCLVSYAREMGWTGERR